MIFATRSMHAASATLDPPNLWTFQACTLRTRFFGRPLRHPPCRCKRWADGDSSRENSLIRTLKLYLLAARQAN
jgi:hypothetical protein